MKFVMSIIFLSVFVFSGAVAWAEIPAFPGAEGFGANANGGRGGDVYTVTNLNSSGAGSLIYGIENAPAAGRTIVFAVSGYIPIAYNSDTGNQTIRIVQNNVTIAGQTAPGDGIGLKDGRILVTGNNAVLRHLRIRHGKYGGAGDCLNLESSADNSIIDHVSLMFSTDENISFFNSALNDFTMQYCTSSWGMERHNAGGLWDLQDGSCHHSLWAHHRTRNPKARPYGLLEWINNVTYHWRSEGFIMGDSQTSTDWYANVIGCYYLSIDDYEFGLDTTPLSKARIADDGYPNFHLYLADTLIDADGDGVLNGTDQGYGIVAGDPYPLAGTTPGTVSYYQSATPFSGAPVAVSIDDPLTAYKKVLSSAGALRLDASAASLRDELDTLLIDSVENQESILVAKDDPVNEDDPPKTGEALLATDYGISNSGFGTLTSTAAPTDSDGDGMPDYWELALGSNPGAQDHNTAFANNGSIITASTFFPSATPAGYTYLEEYLHFCAVPHAAMAKNTADEPASLTVDLSRYTRGFTDGPEFTISDIYGGTVQQFSADGTTPSSTGPVVVFTPTQDFTGRAGFDFNVTDADGSSWTQPFAILVTTDITLEAPIYAVNCGGGDEGTFEADAYYTNGGTYTNTSTIDMTGLIYPAPEAVYQCERHGDFSYVFPGLMTDAYYKVRLHFAEIYHSAVDSRVFNVAINGTDVLTNYDIFAVTGARYKAHIEEFTTPCDASGQITIEFTSITDNSLICGIEIYDDDIPDPTGGQAEDADYGNGAVFEDTNGGFNGTGYVNFPTSGGYLEFTGIDGGIGGDVSLDIRYALGATGTRTGYLVVNGTPQSITFDSTSAWNTWDTKSLTVTLNSGTNNTIRFESNGEDLANIDEITVIGNQLTNCQQVQSLGYRLDADLNGDCEVEMADLMLLIDQWLSSSPEAATPNYSPDLVADNEINLADFAVMAGQWLICNDPEIAGCIMNW